MAAAQIEQMTSLDSLSTTLAARRISDSSELFQGEICRNAL